MTGAGKARSMAKKLRTGLTTGTCAAAAAKAATAALCGKTPAKAVSVLLPNGSTVQVPVRKISAGAGFGRAEVVKDAGDDADITHGATIRATVRRAGGGETVLRAGPGVGTVTMPGLQVPVGKPAINPVPEKMIRRTVGEITDIPLEIAISIPGGRRLAEKTFNPRLGVVGGLSIIGTTGIVRPFSRRACRDALKLSFSVARAAGVACPVLAPGHIGARAAAKIFRLAKGQLIEVGNEWAAAMKFLAAGRFAGAVIAGHPGKLAKLAMNQWDTHSGRSRSAVDFVANLINNVGRATCCTRDVLKIAGGTPAPQKKVGRATRCTRNIKQSLSGTPTVEGLFASLADPRKKAVGSLLAGLIRSAAAKKLAKPGNRAILPAVVLFDMAGEELGRIGDFCGLFDKISAPRRRK